MVLTGAGVRSSPGILMVPLENEFDWSRATIALAVSINLILYGCIGPFAAAIMERFGVRRSVVYALALVAGGVASTSMMRHPWQLITDVGLRGRRGHRLSRDRIVSRRSRRAGSPRGAASWSAFSAAAGATGQLLFLPVMAMIASAFGWRATVIVDRSRRLRGHADRALLMRDRPSDVGLMPYGETGTPAAATAAPKGNPVTLAFAALRDASRFRDFWLLAGTYFVCGASTNGLIGTHLIPACIDHGFSEVTGAALLATMGVFNFIGTTSAGWLSDRFDNRGLLSPTTGCAGFRCSICRSRSSTSTDDPVRGVLRPRLVRDRVADRAADHQHVRPREGRHGLRLGVHRASAWRRVCGVLGGLLRVNFGGYMEAFMLSGADVPDAAVAGAVHRRRAQLPTPAVAAA